MPLGKSSQPKRSADLEKVASVDAHGEALMEQANTISAEARQVIENARQRLRASGVALQEMSYSKALGEIRMAIYAAPADERSNSFGRVTAENPGETALQFIESFWQ